MENQSLIIRKYFPRLSEQQILQFQQLSPLYEAWNKQINVISRKDIEHLYLHHVLHSLSIGKVIQFKKETTIIDIGTGGGFPGIPLAILFPDVHFHLVDSIGKKIKVAKQVAQEVNLKNVTVEYQRAEQIFTKYDFVVSRAVSSLKTICEWSKYLISKKSINDFPNGIFCLKGGNIENEISELSQPVQLYPIDNFFDENYFKEKFVVYINTVSL